MNYRVFGNTGLRLSALGFGMNRFSPSLLGKDQGEVDRAAALVEQAVMECGINYIDAAHTYSGGYAHKIISCLSSKVKERCHFSIKTSTYAEDMNAKDSYLRVKTSLKAMGLERVDFGFLWAIRSLEEYRWAIAPGGLYEGLCMAKADGLISHICVSLHTAPEESIQILREGLFEGATLSCHPLNFSLMQPVLDEALSLGIGIFTMNSLAGGMILQYPQIMPDLPKDFTVAQASFARLLAHPAVTCCLSGMNSSEQLRENVGTFQILEKAEAVSWAQAGNIRQGFCTSCGYCSGCPKGIPIPALMQGYNAYMVESFPPKYGVTDQKRLADIYAFETVKKSLCALPETPENPCIRCGRCERKCTQKLPIIQRVSEMYHSIERCGFSQKEWRGRLQSILSHQSGKRVYLYPAGLYTRNVLRLYRQLIGSIDFDLHVFDRNSDLVGTELIDGYMIEPTSAMSDEDNTLCLITNFTHEESIFQELTERVPHLKIVRLHKPEDVPWLYLFW